MFSHVNWVLAGKVATIVVGVAMLVAALIIHGLDAHSDDTLTVTSA